MGLFASKVERILGKCLRKSHVLHVRYLDGVKEHPCRIVHLASNCFVMEGFASEPREEMLMVRIAELKASFKTRLGKVSKDNQGKIVYYCALPKVIQKQASTRQHFLIYPEGQAMILPDGQLKETLQMPVWDMAREGVALVNESGLDFKRGFRFNVTTIQIKHDSFTVPLIVLYKTKRPQGKGELEILGCKFLETPANLDELLATCQKVDAL